MVSAMRMRDALAVSFLLHDEYIVGIVIGTLLEGGMVEHKTR